MAEEFAYQMGRYDHLQSQQVLGDANSHDDRYFVYKGSQLSNMASSHPQN